MIIGHFPAGYILSKKLQHHYQFQKYLWVGLAASILPDFDAINFYLDNFEQNHHDYWTHIPFFWFLMALFTFVPVYLKKNKDLTVIYILFFTNIFLHLFIDTITGEVKWLYPISDKYIAFFDWTLIYSFWGMILIYWSFLLEILVYLWALLIFLRSRRTKNHFSHSP